MPNLPKKIYAFGLAATLCLSFLAAPAHAAKRVALVIGNNAYENVPALQKAVNDSEAISQELAKLGFDVVSAENVGRRAMSRALVELESKIESGDTALIYFAGHGFAVDGTNYLLPVDVPAAGPGEEGLVRDASFAANGLSDRLQEKGAATVILILDACRDNPFAQAGKRSIGLTRGLSRMDPAEGMFVLFSAGQGQSALDRLSDTDKNPNSVFTRTLLKELEEPGLSMVQIAKRTQSQVKELAAKVDHVQVPAYYDQIVGDLYLAPKGAALAKGSVDTLQEGGGIKSGQGIDALFLPAGRDELPELAPLLASEDLSSGRVQFIGTGQWDYPNIGSDRALLGGWYPAPDPKGWSSFVQRYSKTYGGAPPRIASLAYDAISLAVSLSANPPGQRFTAAQLTRPTGFSGVDGLFRLLSDGTCERGLAILEVREGGPQVIDPAPSSFATASSY